MSIVRTVLRARWISTAVVGSLAGHPVAGNLHSVYRSAVNLLLEGQLVTLVRPEAGRPPNGVVVQNGPDFLVLGLEPGMEVLGDGAALWVPAVDLLVDMATATTWSPRLEPFSIAHDDRVSANLELAASFAAARAPGAGFGPLLRSLASQFVAAPRGEPRGLQFSKALRRNALPDLSPLCLRAWPAMLTVLEALEAGDPLPAAAKAEPLIGLGVGLTPSGDDFLIGLSAALSAVGHPSARPFAEACGSAARGRSSLIAETLLACAALGFYSGHIHDLLAAILVEGGCSIQDRVAATIGWGATSGIDGLLGLLLGTKLGIQPVG